MKKIKNNAPITGIFPLLTVSLPLMLSNISSSVMLLSDRFFLARYSLNAFNATVTIGSIILMLQIGVNICASAADVFVGQLNGAEKKSNLVAPTWQMIWFSLSTLIIFLPLAFSLSAFNPSTIKNHSDEIFYLKLLLATCPLSALQLALSSFFVGRQQTMVPFISTLVGNGINLGLNYLLIFGCKQLNISEYGLKGAGVATAIAQCTSLGILTLYFFSKTNRQEYATHNAILKPDLMVKILKLGFPNAIGQFMIAGAWSIFFILMNRLDEASITLASIMQTLTGFFVFMIQGLSRGVVAMSSNFIGSKQVGLISRVLFSGIRIAIYFCIGLFALFIVFSSAFLRIFFNTQDIETVSTYFGALKWALLWGWLAFLLKSIRAIFSGLLTASGKTRFVMWNEAISIWICFIVPVWICVHFFTLDVAWAYFIAFIYNLIAVGSYSLRFYKMNWEREGQVI